MLRGSRTLRLPVLGGALLASLAVGAPARAAEAPFAKIDHFIVIYMENRSFDSLFGLFPGADGLANAGAAAVQVDKEGKPYAVLPPVIDTDLKPPAPDPRFPADLPNKPFDIAKYVPLNQKTGDLIHRFHTNQLQINGGRNDKYVAWSNAQALTMGYYDGSTTELWRLAKEFTLADAFFQGAFGGSLLNHFWMACACTPRYEDAPAALRATFDAKGVVVTDGVVTPDGYAVNTIQTRYTPHAPGTDPAKLLPPQTLPTLGDRLSEKGVSWVWYSGGWNDAVAGKADPLFQFHHQPYAYFENYGDGTPGRAEHLKDVTDFETAIAEGTLPAVSFYKPIGELNEHPGYAEIATGDRHVADLVAKIRASAQWPHTAIIITYDENGGLWDHAAPPKIDRWGPGTRIPTLVVSPLARKGFIDHTSYDSTSILATIEHRYGLKPLTERDAKAADLANAFED